MGDYAKQGFDVVQEVHYPDDPTGSEGWVPLLQNRAMDKPFFMWLASFDNPTNAPRGNTGMIHLSSTNPPVSNGLRSDLLIFFHWGMSVP